MMKVCVVGAGPIGLTTIKQLLDEGHEVTCFEKQGELGGIWYRTGDDPDFTKAYDNIILTTSIRLMAFSDFMPEGERVFYTRAQYLSYLRAYAEKFRLREHVRFDRAVEGIARLPDGRWRVTVRAGGGGERQEHVFDAVALCAGSYNRPNMNVTGLDRFTGEVMHSAKYRNNQRFAGKRTLVVGMAESGADILREVSDVASECTLSLRTYVKLVPRLHKGNVPTDATRYRAGDYEKWVRACATPYGGPGLWGDTPAARLAFRAFSTLYGAAAIAGKAISRVRRRLGGPSGTASAITGRNPLGEPLEPEKVDVGTELTQEVMNAIDEWNRRSHEALGGSYTPKTFYCKNVSFIPNILAGKLDVNHGEIVGMDGKTVQFSDGTRRDFDAIVLCTGYQKSFSILENVEIKDNDLRTLYKHAFHPDCGGRLALIGFVRPFNGGNPVCAEMQARYFAQLCSGKIELPADLHARIAREKEWEADLTILSARHTECTPSQPLFTDSIAKELGCLPSMKELILDPPLFIKMWFGSFNQASYRLVGPHNMREDARRRILEEWLVGADVILRDVALSWLPHFVHPRNLTTPRSITERLPKGAALPTHPLRPRRPAAPARHRDAA
jgi:dimethylaniline monooxygenase (N-oxide forming)